MSEPMQPCYSTEWINDPNCVFLGTDINPKTKRIYDYWIVNLNDGPSYTCRHGDLDSEYGSGRIEHLDGSNLSSNILNKFDQDFIFGIVRSQYFALLYLATNKRPLLEY